jgi:hypothetical protein
MRSTAVVRSSFGGKKLCQLKQIGTYKINFIDNINQKGKNIVNEIQIMMI